MKTTIGEETARPAGSTVDALVTALSSKDRLRLQPAGAYAANLLGLSGQVPARVGFLADGTGRTGWVRDSA